MNGKFPLVCDNVSTIYMPYRRSEPLPSAIAPHLLSEAAERIETALVVGFVSEAEGWQIISLLNPIGWSYCQTNFLGLQM